MSRIFGLILALVCAVSAQDAPSLADAAKKAHEDKPKARVVVTEDNLKVRKSPFPDIAFEGDMNTDEIASSLKDYRTSHTAKETEDAFHEWFNHFDELMLKLIRENNEISSRKQERYYDPDKYSYDKYQEARQQVNHEVRSDELDRRAMLKNGFMMARIQQTLYQLRNNINRYGIRYDWLKVRNGNGIGTY